LKVFFGTYPLDVFFFLILNFCVSFNDAPIFLFCGVRFFISNEVDGCWWWFDGGGGVAVSDVILRED
jgi:hypothetical protein